jgi:hypothetical protein
MQVKLALLADYANITAEGKLNILGIFDRISVPAVPAGHPQMHLILRLDAHAAEKGRPHALEIRLHDPDGQTLIEFSGEVVPQGGGPGEAVSTNQIVTINNLGLPVAGEYMFVVFVDRDLKAEIPLVVELRAGMGGPPPGQA